jgi:hypothetical protein
LSRGRQGGRRGEDGWLGRGGRIERGGARAARRGSGSGVAALRRLGRGGRGVWRQRGGEGAARAWRRGSGRAWEPPAKGARASQRRGAQAVAVSRSGGGGDHGGSAAAERKQSVQKTTVRREPRNFILARRQGATRPATSASPRHSSAPHSMAPTCVTSAR